MKKNLMKKVFAVTLSVAMACSMIPATNPVTASAAASVKLKTTFKTLKVGAKYKLTLKNNTKSWKVTKATSANSAVAKVYKTTTKAVKVKGKSVGRAVVKVRLKTGKSVKNLKCKFNVIDNSTPTPTPEPTPDPTPVQTDATVKTQEELDAALANSNITKITIDTQEEVKFVIKEGTYSTVDLIVNAPNADVENSATFRNITIQAIKGETWTEKGKGNVFKLLAKLVSMIIDKDAVVASIDVATADADVKLTINGEATNVTLSAKAKVDLKGESKKPVKMNVASNAKDSEIGSAVPVDVETNADVKVNLAEGAEGSKVKFGAAGLNVELDNKTKEPVEITKHDNTKATVAAGRKQTVTSPASGGATTPINPGTNTPIVNKLPCNTAVITSDAAISSATVTVTTGGAGIISGGTLRFTVTGAKEVSGGAIECRATVSDKGSVIYYSGWQDCTGSTTFVVSQLRNCTGSFNVKLDFRVKETATTLAGNIQPVDTDYSINVSSAVVVPTTNTDGTVKSYTINWKDGAVVESQN